MLVRVYRSRKLSTTAKFVSLFGMLMLVIIATTSPARADESLDAVSYPADLPRPTIPVIGYVYHAHDRALACYDSNFVRDMQSQIRGNDVTSIRNIISEKIRYGECVIIDKNNRVDVMNVSASGDLTQVTLFNQIEQYWIGTAHIDLDSRNAP